TNGSTRYRSPRVRSGACSVAVGPVQCCLRRQHLPRFDAHGHPQQTAATRPAEAFPGAYRKRGAMGGANDGGVANQELARYIVEIPALMRAFVVVGEHLLALPHEDDLE